MRTPEPPDGTLPTVYERPNREPRKWTGSGLLAGKVLGKYRLNRQLGAGGMGAVYEAEHIEIGKPVAVKVLSTQLAADAKAHERFRREATSLSKLDHPNIVNVTDFGEENGTPYLVMELLLGKDLNDHLADHRRGLPVTNAVDIMVSVCSAVFTAHEAGIIHRDLKPRNIFLATNRVDVQQPKVLDFGISRLVTDAPGESLTDSGALVGTIPYLPPEHVKGKPCDARSDQYTLGVVLSQCLTGRLPHDGQSQLEIMQEIAAGRFYRPTVLRPDLSLALEQVILRAMSLEPADRFDSVLALGRELLGFASPSERVRWNAFYVGKVPQPRPQTEASATAPLPPPVRVPAAPTRDARRAPSGSRSASERELGSVNQDAVAASPEAHATTEDIGSRPRTSRWVVVVATVAAIAGTAFFLSRSRRLRPTVEPMPEATAAPASNEVTIEVLDLPAGATAKLDGWSADLPLRLARSDRLRQLTISAPGFETASQQLLPTESREIRVALVPIARTQEPAGGPENRALPDESEAQRSKSVAAPAAPLAQDGERTRLRPAKGRVVRRPGTSKTKPSNSRPDRDSAQKPSSTAPDEPVEYRDGSPIIR